MNHYRSKIALIAGILTCFESAQAADVYWDATPGTPNGASDGGAGTWDTSTANWDDGSYASWNNTNNDVAVFGGTGGVVDLGANVTVGGLTFNTTNYSVGPGLGPYGITFGSPGTIDVSTGTTTITAAIGGSNKITKTGSGTLYLNGANTFSGDIDISGGRLQIANGTNEGAMLGAASNTLTFIGNSELYNSNGTATVGQGITINNGVTGKIGGAFGERTQVNGVFAGSGTLLVQGYSAGFDVELLNTANTFTGDIQLRSGDGVTLGVRSLVDSVSTISLQSNSNLGGTFEYMSGATSSMTLNSRQFELAVNGNSGTNFGRQASIRNNAAIANTVTINTSLAITGTGNKTFILGGGNGGNNAFNGAIVDALGTSKLTLRKMDGGKWILGGANTYEGDTIVDAGTLELANSGELLFIVGALGENNSILGDATNANLNLNGTLVFDLAGASTAISDSWNIVDVANLNETYGGSFGVKSTLGSFTDVDGDLWTLAENGVLYEFQESTGVLTVGVIPEPSVALLGGLGMLLLLRRRRA